MIAAISLCFFAFAWAGVTGRILRYGFLPTLIVIALGVLPVNSIKKCGEQGIPWCVKTPASAANALVAPESSGAINTRTPGSYVMPAVTPATSTTTAPICDSIRIHSADFNIASKVRARSSDSGSENTQNANRWPPKNFITEVIFSCCSGSSVLGCFNLANSKLASAARCSANAARSRVASIMASFSARSAVSTLPDMEDTTSSPKTPPKTNALESSPSTVKCGHIRSKTSCGRNRANASKISIPSPNTTMAVQIRSHTDRSSDHFSSALRMAVFGIPRRRRRSFGLIEVIIWGLGGLLVFVIVRWF